MNYTKIQIAVQCRISGPNLKSLPSSVDGIKLLWGLSGNESSFGIDCIPRYEPAYDIGGIYGDNQVMVPLLVKYGRAAACSYGPWQILFANAESYGYTPDDLSDLSKVTQTTVSYLNFLLVRFKPTSLTGIGECWNAGHTMSIPPPGVARYVTDLVKNYSIVMPI